MAKILLVDDVAGIRRSVAHILKLAGHEVVEAENGRVAIQKLKDDNYNLVLTDILMPEQDGSEVISFLCTLSKRPRIIAMSGGGGQATADQALTLARNLADGVLMKPFGRAQLAEALDRVLIA